MSSDTKNAVKKFVKDMSKAPAPKQLAVGATAGWLAGYLTMKVGKAAATMVGGSLLVLQIAHHKGKRFTLWNFHSSVKIELINRSFSVLFMQNFFYRIRKS